jgi:hypothetical protein
MLSEIVISVDLKHLDLHLLNVFDISKDFDCLIKFERRFVVVGDLNVCRSLILINNILCSIVILNLEIIQVINFRLQCLKIILIYIIGELLIKVNSFCDLKVLKV